jgi:hypothetical protein
MGTSSKNIFITGNTANVGLDQLNEFELARQELRKLGFEEVATAADDLPMGDELKTLDGLQHYLKLREEKLKDSQIVLALNNNDKKDAYFDKDIQKAFQSMLLWLHDKEHVGDCMTFINRHKEAKIS